MYITAYKLKLTNVQKGVAQQEIIPVTHRVTNQKIFINRYLILALTLACCASQHSGMDTWASWHEDRCAVQVANKFLPKSWI